MNDPYDTSAFNIDYSDEDDMEPIQYKSKPYKNTTKPAPKPAPKPPAKMVDITDGVTTDDDYLDHEDDYSVRPSAESGPKGSENMSVDEYGFVIKPYPNNRSRAPR